MDPVRQHETTSVVIDGRYTLRRQLSTDELADCWQADDAQLARKVVVKLLHADRTREAWERFQREAIAAAAIDHAHVACQYAVELRDDLAYTVSEHVPGPSLHAVQGRHQHLDTATTATLAYQAASGLAAIHASGVVHRGLGPKTLRIGTDGRLRIVDYRTARLPKLGIRGAKDPTDRHLIAPEVLDDDAATPRSDIYSLGQLLHATWYWPHARTRSRPVRGLLTSSARERRRTRLQQLLTAATSQTPTARPSADKLAQHLRALLDHEPERQLEALYTPPRERAARTP